MATKDKWTLTRYGPGMISLGQRIDTAPKRILVQPYFVGQVICKTTGTAFKNTANELEVYYGQPPGSETASGMKVTAYNRFSDVASGKWAMAHWSRGEAVDGGAPDQQRTWELGAGEC